MRNDGLGTGSIDDPYDGSTPGLFDSIMGSIEENTLIHLGPGKFQTRGFTEGQPSECGWSVKTGQRIVGAGIDVTVLKLVGANISVRKLAIMGSGSRVDNFETCELTFDCNLDAQSASRIAVSAVIVRGAWSHIHNVRAIHFGTTDDDPTTLKECFVFFVAGASSGFTNVKGCVVEDCIIEEPALNTAYTTTCVITGKDGTYYHEDCVIRNNFIDCTYCDRPVRVASISRAGTTATVTTALPHGRLVGQGVVLSGAMDGVSLSTHLNGSFVISQVTNATQFTITVDNQGTTSPTGEMWLGKYSSQKAQITAVETTQSAPFVATITTLKPHNRLVGQKVNVTGVATLPPTPNPYNGLATVIDVPSPYVLKYAVGSAGSGTLDPAARPYPFSGTNLFATSAAGGERAVTQGNHGVGLTNGVYYDTFSGIDLTVRKNTFRAVLTGVFQNLVGANYSQDQLLCQKNTIDLVLPISYVWGPPAGIEAFGDMTPSSLTRLLVMGNLIQHVDGAVDASATSYAVYFGRVTHAIVENNIAKVGKIYPLSYSETSTWQFTNNGTPEGSWMPAYDNVAKVLHADELATLSAANEDVIAVHQLLLRNAP